MGIVSTISKMVHVLVEIIGDLVGRFGWMGSKLHYYLDGDSGETINKNI